MKREESHNATRGVEHEGLQAGVQIHILAMLLLLLLLIVLERRAKNGAGEKL